MFRKVLILTSLICFSMSAIPGDALADRKRLKKPSEKRGSEPVKIHNTRNMLIGFVCAGKLLGKITDYVQETKDQLPYGFGLGYEHYVRSDFGIGIEMRMLWLSPPVEDLDQIRSTEYRIFGVYRFRPEASKTLYAKFGIGQSNGKSKISDDEITVSRTHLRLGIGLIVYSSSKFNTRIEFSYNSMLHPDGEEIYGRDRFPYSLNYIALDAGLE